VNSGTVGVHKIGFNLAWSPDSKSLAFVSGFMHFGTSSTGDPPLFGGGDPPTVGRDDRFVVALVLALGALPGTVTARRPRAVDP
jgi:hypothetical protein